MISPSVHVAPLPATAVFVFVPNSVTSLHVRIVSVDLQTAVALTTMLLARNLVGVFFEQAEKPSAATAGLAIPAKTTTKPTPVASSPHLTLVPIPFRVLMAASSRASPTSAAHGRRRGEVWCSP